MCDEAEENTKGQNQLQFHIECTMLVLEIPVTSSREMVGAISSFWPIFSIILRPPIYVSECIVLSVKHVSLGGLLRNQL